MAAERHDANSYLPYVLLVLTNLFWSGNGIAGRFAAGEIDPLGLTFWRWAGALILLLPIALPHAIAQRAILLRHWRLLTMFGFLSVTGFTTFYYYALSLSTAINVTLVATTIPAVIVALSWLLYRDTISRRALIGTLVSFAGVVAIVARGDLGVLLGLAFNPGDLVALVAVFIWALYCVFLRYRPPELHPFAFLLGLVVPGVILNLAIPIFDPTSLVFEPTWPNLAVIGYIALFPGLLAYIFFNAGVKAVGASIAGQFSYLVPVFAAVLAVIVLGETFEVYHLIGMGVIFVGLYLAGTRRA